MAYTAAMTPDEDWEPESRRAWLGMLLRGPRAWPRAMHTDIARITMIICAAAMASALTPVVTPDPDIEAMTIVFAVLAALPILSQLAWREVCGADEVPDGYDRAMATAAAGCEGLFVLAALAALALALREPKPLCLVGIVAGVLTASWQLRASVAERGTLR